MLCKLLSGIKLNDLKSCYESDYARIEKDVLSWSRFHGFHNFAYFYHIHHLKYKYEQKKIKWFNIFFTDGIHG